MPEIFCRCQPPSRLDEDQVRYGTISYAMPSHMPSPVRISPRNRFDSPVRSSTRRLLYLLEVWAPWRHTHCLAWVNYCSHGQLSKSTGGVVDNFLQLEVSLTATRLSNTRSQGSAILLAIVTVPGAMFVSLTTQVYPAATIAWTVK